MRNAQQRGIALVALVVLILVSAIILVPLVGFVSTSVRFSSYSADYTRALAASQAGIQQAVYQFRSTGLWTPQTSQLVANRSFITGGNNADLLRVNTLSAYTHYTGIPWCPHCHTLNNLTISNPVSNRTLRLSSLSVRWFSNTPQDRLTRVYLGNSTLWDGSVPWGESVNLQSNTISTGSLQELKFSFNMRLSEKIIIIDLVMNDGSTRRIQFADGHKGFDIFRIAATGEVTNTAPGGSEVWRQTLLADYDVAAGEILLLTKLNKDL